MAMNTVSVATLKQQLSRYLQRVEGGSEFVVTSHRRPVARLVPESGDGVCVRQPTLPRSRLATVKGVTAKRGFSAVSSLLEDRRSR